LTNNESNNLNQLSEEEAEEQEFYQALIECWTDTNEQLAQFNETFKRYVDFKVGTT